MIYCYIVFASTSKLTLIGDCYRLFHSRFSLKPARFSWVIEDKLAASGRLMRQSQVAWALKHGIRSVVTIKETPLNADWFSIEGCGLNYRHLKVEDYGAPPLPELDDIVNYIDNEINKNDRPVIVHCNGGSGRTGTILAAYFMKKEKLTAEQALAKVNEIRGRAPRHRKQIDTLKEYQNYLTSSKQHY